MPEYGFLMPTREIVLSSSDPETLTAKSQTEVVEMARRAEAVGFDSAWVGDSVLAKPRLEAFTTLAAVGAATDALKLGTAVYLPPLRDPVHVAHLTATLNQLCGGRFRFGVGVGGGPDVRAEYENLNVPFDQRGARLTELLSVVTDLWSGDSVDHDGQFYSLEKASIGFGPVRDPAVYIPTAAFNPTAGFPTPIRERLVTYGDGWLPISLSPGDYRISLSRLYEILADAGQDTTTFTPAIYLDVVVEPDEETALAEARAFYDRYYPDWDTLTAEEIHQRGAFGPASKVETRLGEYVDAGAETLVIRFAATNQREQFERFRRVADF
jgi:alkanesulfonate monooxygenase SsuD/methylene tetrahydromethanopterin reductase-like flavin-dependent oxidoreductase (luciferase family)